MAENMAKKTFKEKLKTDLILLDGAFGTYAQSLGLLDTDFKDKPGCMEYLSLSRPDFVGKIHSDYLEAGSDAVETNTFGGNAIKLAEYEMADKVYDINLISAKLARSVADKFATASYERYVVGSMGPTGKLPLSTDPDLGNITYKQLVKIFYDQALGLIDGGADALLIETGQDLLEMKAAAGGIKEALKECRKDIAVIAQATLSNNGRMLLGTRIAACMAVLGYLDIDVIGINCGTGPVEMEGALDFLSKNCPVFFSAVPNAGLPIEVNGETIYPLPPAEMAYLMARLVRKYRIDVIGGCCGTNPEYIRQMRKTLGKYRKRRHPENHFYASFYQGFDLGKLKAPLKVGERINTQGSKKIKELLKNENYDGIVEIGKLEEKQGADILDVCTVLTERATEKKDTVFLVRRLAESVEIPLMIDSTAPDVIEEALENYPGTAFINSVNLEDGGKKARQIYELAKKHAGFIVNLVIDEQGMAKTVERKLDIAKRLYKIAVNEYNLEGHRLLFDMLTFTLGTGEKEYADSAVNTYKAIKAVKKELPDVFTVLGVSNISFGLSKEARKIINMVFLHHAVKAGLDMAIVNPAEYIEYKNIGTKERRLAEDLIFNTSPKALERLVGYFSQRAPEKTKEFISVSDVEEDLTIEQKLKKCIFDRDKVNIIPCIDEALEKYSAQEIINDILIDAMKVVGEKLERGEMVLPYVLQSAEVMKKAIDHLEKFLPAGSSEKKGKVLLATVFGDVHDIGKNLVKMILQNNGFSVVDLGKQVTVEKIVHEAQKNKVDAIGLSALLVSTARYMKDCVQFMHKAGLNYPIIIGGAPTNERFALEISKIDDKTAYEGGVFYAKDAFRCLSIVRALADSRKKKEVLDAYHKQFEEQGLKISKGSSTDVSEKRRTKRGKLISPPFYGIRSLSNIPVDEVFLYLDEIALFNMAWGARLQDKKQKERLFEKEYKPLLQELKESSIRKGWLDLKAVYGYFKCRVFKEDMEILDEEGNVFERIRFPRSKNGVSLADYFCNEPEGYDITAFQAVTVGSKINDTISMFNETGEFTRSFLLHGLSVHMAEAVAAYVHDKIRKELKLKKGQGKRYSPGYSLWPQIEDQKKIFRILDAEKRIGIHLTKACQIVPEQSTTAMIISNEAAEY